MAYTIQKTNGDTLVTIPDTELNSDYGVTLIGRNYSGYGLYLNDNFIGLLENFASGQAPAQPLAGQVWFNNTDNTLQVWNGTIWKKMGFSSASSTAPTASGRTVGDQWYDTNNQQLNVWNGQLIANVPSILTTTSSTVSLLSSDAIRINDILTTTTGITANSNVRVTQILNSTNVKVNQSVTIASGQVVSFTRDSGWYTIGPSYTRTQQLTGIFPRDIVDTQGTTRTVGLIYQRGKIIGSISKENEYAPREADAIDRLPLIKPGITLLEDAAPQFVRTVLNNVVGSGGSTTISLSSTDGLAVGDFVISADVAYSDSKQISEIFAANSAVTINTATTLSTNDIVTFQRGVEQSNLFYGTATNAQQLDGISADRFATLESAQIFQSDVTIQGNLYAGNGFELFNNGGTIGFKIVNVDSGFDFYANLTGQGSSTRVLGMVGNTGLMEVLGNPVTSTGVATKSYVDTNDNVVMTALTANVTALIGTAGASRRDFGNISNVLDQYSSNFTAANAQIALRATIASPEFTGTPSAPTATEGTDTTQIATTEFVTTAVETLATATTANSVLQQDAIDLKAPIASPTFTGTPSAPSTNNANRSTQLATTYFVGNVVDQLSTTLTEQIGLKSPLQDPVFIGNPTAPTAAPGDNSGSIANTEFVALAVAAAPQPNLVPYASRISPTLEGIPRAPTAPEGTANTWIATTQFVAQNSPVVSVANKTGVIVLEHTDINGAAPLQAPVFTGSAQAETPVLADRSTRIATTEWVGNITANLAPRSNPVFTGVVEIATPSISSNLSIATTCSWVNTRIAQGDVPKWGGSRKYVESRAPDDAEGANGDIWFQYAN